MIKAVRVTGFDTSVPNVARIYNALFGGKDNYDAGRRAVARILELSRMRPASRGGPRFGAGPKHRPAPGAAG